MTGRSPRAVAARPARAGLCLVLLILAAGCGRWDAREGWDPAAVRAVARAAAAGDAVAVLGRTGGPGGEELSWGVRQALTTGGFQVVDSADMTGTGVPVLVLESSRRDGDDWVMHTHMLQQPGAGPSAAGPSRTWRVRCQDDLCEASAIDE